MVEKVFVENIDRSQPFNYGIISYKIIADYVFADLAVSGALESVRILVDIEKPFFFIHAKIKIMEEKIRISDITTITLEKDGIHITIEDESYAPDLLQVLWKQFGRENVTQIDRWNLIVPSNLITIENLKQIVAVDPRDRITNKILDAMNRIIPEAFRVRKTSFKDDYITIIASENPLEPTWIQLAENALKIPPLRIPEEYLEKLKQTPKVSKKKIVPWKTHEFQESIK